MKALGVLALLAVIVQGVLGGTRVTQVSTFLAAVHGCLGQAFFGLMVALCVLTGRDWHERLVPDGRHRSTASRSLVLLALVVGQIVLGSWLRHFGTLAAVHCTRSWRWRFGLMPCVCCRAGQAAQAGCLRRSFPSSRGSRRLRRLQIVLGIVALVYLLPLGRNLPRPVAFYRGRRADRSSDQRGAPAGRDGRARICGRFVFCGSAAGGPAVAKDRSQSQCAGNGSAAVDWEAVA